MVKKLLIILLLFSSTLSFFSQEKNILMSGTVQDSISIIKNVNIINLKTSKGTSTNDKGEFRMFVKLGDSIRVSSIQHIPKIILIKKKHIDNKKIRITLQSNTFELDAFELKRHNLSGRLGIDTKSVPTNKKDSLLRVLLDFSSIDFSEVDYRIDANQRMKPPIVNTVPNSLGGAGASATIPFKDSERLWALRRKFSQKKAFPNKILSELGDKFFFDQLKIPVEKYFHFLEYCNPLGIEKLHKDNKILELIKILRKESIEYLKIIKEE